MSWIHEHDFVRAIEWLIHRDDFTGPVNIAAPHPVPNQEFMQALRKAWGTRVGLPAARWMLEIGTWLLRTESEFDIEKPARRAGALARSWL